MESMKAALIAVGTVCSLAIIFTMIAYVRDLEFLAKHRKEQQEKALKEKIEVSKQKRLRARESSAPRESSVEFGAEDSRSKEYSKENSKESFDLSKDSKKASSEDELSYSRSKSGTDSQILDSGVFAAMRPKTFDVVVEQAKVKNTQKTESYNLFQYMRVGISILGALYPIWYILTYYTSYRETRFLRNCQILIRIDNVLFVLFRGSILTFYVLRLRIVQFAEPEFKYELYGLVSGICIASLFGLFQSIDINPFIYKSGCDYKIGTIGFAGYTVYMILFFLINVVLFKRFVKSIKAQQLFMQAANSQATRNKAVQFDSLIRRTRYGFISYTVIALAADLLYTVIYSAFFEEVHYNGTKSSSLAALFALCDTLYYLDAVIGSLSVLSTHARFKQMLVCGLDRVKRIRSIRSGRETNIPNAKITELHRQPTKVFL